MNPMTETKVLRGIVVALIFVWVIATIAGCASTETRPMVDWDEIASEITVTHREYITLRTGQVCEIKQDKIVSCERDASLYAESVEDIKAIVEEE